MLTVLLTTERLIKNLLLPLPSELNSRFTTLGTSSLRLHVVLTLETSEMSAIFQVHNQKQLNLIPRSSRLTVH